MSGLYASSFSPARVLSPQIRGAVDIESQYLAELLAEHQKLGPFVQVLPICSRLLNQEIIRVSSRVSSQGCSDYDRLQHGSLSPMASSNRLSSEDLSGWNGLQPERSSVPQGMPMDWRSAQSSPSLSIVKKILRLEIPVDKYPNSMRLVPVQLCRAPSGTPGNSLKRVEACTGCRVYIRGQGSIKDPGKEEKLRGKPAYEHLNDPLHVLIEAELPVNVVDLKLQQAQEIIEELLRPVEESQDFYKRQQLRELAMLNSRLREESPGRAAAAPLLPHLATTG
ncbi:unnamed protein product [Spirodela intermedia]|uniref:Uncharacterized protein n=1 Tax=Spirodela intermedia TaxID=51605 RepID=A0A7I8IY14_SPIIN|nr:unnamed protein product [Spirodela intermedia]CAA6661891.1 unnamed protein product [Spirodela intermedia]